MLPLVCACLSTILTETIKLYSLCTTRAAPFEYWMAERESGGQTCLSIGQWSIARIMRTHSHPPTLAHHFDKQTIESGHSSWMAIGWQNGLSSACSVHYDRYCIYWYCFRVLLSCLYCQLLDALYGPCTPWFGLLRGSKLNQISSFRRDGGGCEKAKAATRVVASHAINCWCW